MKTKRTDEVILLGKQIKKIIESKKLRVMDVAHDANLDATNLRKYIRGSQEMKITTALRIASALGVTAGELLNELVTKKEGR